MVPNVAVDGSIDPMILGFRGRSSGGFISVELSGGCYTLWKEKMLNLKESVFLNTEKGI